MTPKCKLYYGIRGGGIKSLAENTSDRKRIEKQLFLFRIYPEMVKSICVFLCIRFLWVCCLMGIFQLVAQKARKSEEERSKEI